MITTHDDLEKDSLNTLIPGSQPEPHNCKQSDCYFDLLLTGGKLEMLHYPGIVLKSRNNCLYTYYFSAV